MTSEFLLITLFEIYALIVGFLCYAAVKPVYKKLSVPVKIILVPLALFYVADVYVRVTVGWLVFLEPPTIENRTITYLCNSHVLDADGASYRNYKRYISRAVCRTLNLIQPQHCECMKDIKSD